MSSFYTKKAEQPHAQQSRMREFTVGAPDEFPEIQPMVANLPHQAPGYELSVGEREELQRLRRDTQRSGVKVGDHAKKRIELLANIGRLTKDVEIDNIIFTLRTLKTKETREATMSIFECKNDAEAAFEIRRQSLARAIHQIDGQSVEDVIGGDDFALKLNLIDEFEDAIISKLYNSFNELRQESNIKYGLQNETQAKEVVEDIKKS